MDEELEKILDGVKVNGSGITNQRAVEAAHSKIQEMGKFDVDPKLLPYFITMYEKAEEYCVRETKRFLWTIQTINSKLSKINGLYASGKKDDIEEIIPDLKQNVSEIKEFTKKIKNNGYEQVLNSLHTHLPEEYKKQFSEFLVDMKKTDDS